MSVNALEDNHKPDKLLARLQEADADILLIMELTDALEDALSPILHHYPERLQTPVRDGFSICLLSKNPLEDADIIYSGAADTPFLKARTTIKGRAFQVFSAHPKPALSKDWYEDRNAYFRDVVSEIKASDLPVMMMGDFNSVPWETHFKTFLDKTDLQSTVQGYGYKVTWPSYVSYISACRWIISCFRKIAPMAASMSAPMWDRIITPFLFGYNWLNYC